MTTSVPVQTAMKAIHHDHCYVIPHKQGATSLLFPSVSGLNTRIQGGKVVVVTSPDIPTAAGGAEENKEEEGLNEGVAHDHGYYQSTSGSEESQDEKPEGMTKSKSNIALDLPQPNKNSGAIAFGSTSSNMLFSDATFSTLPAQIFAQDEEESPMADGHTAAAKLELSPDVQHYAADPSIRFVIKDSSENQKRQKKTSVNAKPPPEPVTPMRISSRARKPSAKLKEMQEEAEEREKRGEKRKRKAVINIARPGAHVSQTPESPHSTTLKQHLLMSTSTGNQTITLPAGAKIIQTPQGIIVQRAVVPTPSSPETSAQKVTLKKSPVKKRKKEEATEGKNESVQQSTSDEPNTKDVAATEGPAQQSTEAKVLETTEQPATQPDKAPAADKSADRQAEPDTETPAKRSRQNRSKVTEKPSTQEPVKSEAVAEQKPSRRQSSRSQVPEVSESNLEPKTQGRRGRSLKSNAEEEVKTELPKEEPVTEPRAARRGRSAKSETVEGSSSTPSEPETKTPARRGRSRKSESENVSKEETPQPTPKAGKEHVEEPASTRAGRSRRGKAVAEEDETTQKLPARQGRLRKTSEPEPAKEKVLVEQTPTRGRGRPKKDLPPPEAKEEVKEEEVEPESSSDQPEASKKRGRGRPPKNKTSELDSTTTSENGKIKEMTQEASKEDVKAPEKTATRGQVSRAAAAQSATPSEPPAKRGRKAKIVEAPAGEEDSDDQSEEITIRFIPNGDVTKTGNHWGQAIPSDLLLRVFQYVAAVEGPFPFLPRISKVCRLWYEVGQHPSLWTNLDLSGPCIKQYKKTLTSLCRKRISDTTTKLSLQGWSGLTDSDLEMVIQHCKNLEVLNVSGCNKLSSTSVRLIAKQCKNIASVDFSEAWPSSGQHDKSINSLCDLVRMAGTSFKSLSIGTTALTKTETLLDSLMLHCPNLEHLDISNCLFGNYLLKLPLERLQNACPKMKELLLQNSTFQVKDPTNKELAKCPGFAHLETLDISRSPNSMNNMSHHVTDDVLKRILRNAFDLKTLNISGCRHISAEGIEALPIVSLKVLKLASSKPVTQRNVVDVILKWGHSLQQLDLAGNSIDEQIVMRIIDGCPNLSTLDLSGCRGLPWSARRKHNGIDHIFELRQTLSQAMDMV